MTNDARKNGEKSGKPTPPIEHQFKPGNPGRPKGSRNKLGEAFLEACTLTSSSTAPTLSKQCVKRSPTNT